MTGRVIRMPLRPGVEPWLSKKQLAGHFGYSTRWIELRVAEGMPCWRVGNRLRFRVSEVEPWLKERYAT